MNDDYFYIHAFHEVMVDNPHFEKEEKICKEVNKDYKKALSAWQEAEENHQKKLKEYLLVLEQEAREIKREID